MQAMLSNEAPVYVYYTPKSPYVENLDINKLALYALPAKNATPVFAPGITLGDFSRWKDIYGRLYSKPYVDLAGLPHACSVISTKPMTPQFLEDLKNIHVEYSIQELEGYNIFKITRK